MLVYEVPPRPLGRYYSTTFPLTENPISEGGVWVTGADALSTVVRSSGGVAYGTQTGNEYDETPKRYNDSQAYLASFPRNHKVEVTISTTGPGSWSGDLEVEVLLGFSTSTGLRSPQPFYGATHSDGIEVNLVWSSVFGYACNVGRWLDGPSGAADYSSAVAALGIQDGDIFGAQLTLNDNTQTGTVICWITRAGTKNVLGTVTDASLYRVGRPGLGFYRYNDSGGALDPTKFCAAAFTAWEI